MGRRKVSKPAKKPEFNDKSWDATGWSLWGLLYTGAASDRQLKLGITEQFSRARKALGSLGKQVEPMRSKVAEWREELDGFARSITFGEAQDALDRLTEIAAELELQAESDRQSVKAQTKPPPPVDSDEEESDEEESDEEESDEDLEWARRMQIAGFGHNRATAKAPPKIVKSRPYKPPTPAELWTAEQRSMAAQCDNGIGYGSHEVTQGSVLRHLNPGNSPTTAEQYRPGPENTHVRTIEADGHQFWTLGLSHRELRDAGKFSVYRRDGQSNRFVYVSGRRHPKDPNG